MPLTAFTFGVGWFSIAGVPPFSGFFSKGNIVENAWSVTPALWAIGALTAVLTAYYVGREYFLVFYGSERWPTTSEASGAHEGDHASAPHEPRSVMTLPLIVLSVAAFFGGLLNFPWHPHLVFLERWLAPVVGASLFNPHDSPGKVWIFSIVEGVLALAGVAAAYFLWRDTVDRPKLEPRFLFHAWYIDAAFDRFIARPSTALATFSATVIDTKVIDGVVRGVATLVSTTGDRLRKVQTGYVRNYALGIIGGAVVLVAYFLIRAKG
jgi:NADH-quinone oxidoreductase subunit L